MTEVTFLSVTNYILKRDDTYVRARIHANALGNEEDLQPSFSLGFVGLA